MEETSLERRETLKKNWKKRKKSKKWFDKEYEVRGLGRKKHENPKNTLSKAKYHEKLKG